MDDNVCQPRLIGCFTDVSEVRCLAADGPWFVNLIPAKGITEGVAEGLGGCGLPGCVAVANTTGRSVEAFDKVASPVETKAAFTGVTVRGDTEPAIPIGVFLAEGASVDLAHPTAGAAVKPPVALDGFDGITDVSLALVNTREDDCC